MEGHLLREMMEMSHENIVSNNFRNCEELLEARLHWSGCPSCRAEFTGLPFLYKQLGIELEKICRLMMSSFRDDFISQKNSLLAEGPELASSYAKVIVDCATSEYDVLHWLNHGHEILSLGGRADFRPPSSYCGIESSLATCNECVDFISSLEPDVQRFVFAVACSNDLLMAFNEKMQSEHGPITPDNFEDFKDRMGMAIAKSPLDPTTLFSIIEKASIAYSNELGWWPTGTGLTTVAQTVSPQSTIAIKEMKTLHGAFRDWKQDFDNLEDSLKAGQMELARLIEHNRRPATAYEPYIVAQMGSPLYSRLQEKTQRALQLAEYLYNINQEPDGFSLTALTMAQGYENELILRVIWPFVNELLAARTETYNAQGKATHPLILRGKFSKSSVTLGNLGWYLKYDPTMRSKVSTLGFDVEAISKDVALVSALRNRPAHDFSCDRVVADDLRRRILCREGVLSRLHPMVATTADSLTA
jgi:hypothetical protein